MRKGVSFSSVPVLLHGARSGGPCTLGFSYTGVQDSSKVPDTSGEEIQIGGSRLNFPIDTTPLLLPSPPSKPFVRKEVKRCSYVPGVTTSFLDTHPSPHVVRPPEVTRLHRLPRGQPTRTVNPRQGEHLRETGGRDNIPSCPVT